jgi:hypothetical protein
MPTKTNHAISSIHTVPGSPQGFVRVREPHTDSVFDVSRLTINYYEDQVPDFVGEELIRLYGHYYSSLDHLISEKKLAHANTYVERYNNQIISLIIFRKEHHHVVVLNEVIAFTDCEIERFTNYLFKKIPELSMVQFCAVQSNLNHLRYPHLKFNYLEDIVIALPKTTEDFLCNIGKSMRRNLRRYERKLMTLYPSSNFSVFKDDQIHRQDIRDIVALNWERMREKNKISLISDEELHILETQVRKSGLVCTVKIDGKIRAGAICFRTGNNYFLTVIAHDSRYDACSLGTLCCTYIISQCIDLGGKEFHFLWGRYDYKYLLGGIQRDLDKVLIFRSRWHSIAHSSAIYRAWISAKRRQFFLRLHHIKKTNGFAAQLINRASALIRRA